MLKINPTLLLKRVHRDPLGNYQTYCLLQLKIKSLCAISGLLCTVGPVVPDVMTEEAIHNIDFIDLDILGDSF